jgi:hypothetical protein
MPLTLEIVLSTLKDTAQAYIFRVCRQAVSDSLNNFLASVHQRPQYVLNEQPS